jgi:hypothetical protein
MSKLIEEIPNVAMLIFSRCMIENEEWSYHSYSELKVERFIRYRTYPLKRKPRKYHPWLYKLGYAMYCVLLFYMILLF